MVSVIGRANSGKSTLVNALLEEKISAVSPIAQTTRHVIRGIRTESRGQLVLLDTPGLHKAESELGKVMNRNARASVEGCDVALLVVDASVPPAAEDRGWMKRLTRATAACVVALNKSDLPAPYADAYRQAWADCVRASSVSRDALFLSTSGMAGTGLPELLETLFRLSPEGPPLFPEDVLTDFPRKLAMADIIREKIIRGLREELPHSIAVSVESIEEETDVLQVKADVYVLKPSQKGIVIGHKGRQLRRARRAADRELSGMYGKAVHVDLRVRVEKNWNRNFFLLKRLGYVT